MTSTKERVVHIIEWDDMDKRKFFGFGAMLSFAVRTSVYPSHLIKTRLQMQQQNSLYKGTWDALKKIVKYEGVRGLYKGFAVNLISIGSEQMYILSYELMRTACKDMDNSPRTFIAGGFASLVSQTIRVPVDVISQRTMMLGLAVDAQTVKKEVHFKDVVQIARATYHQSGFFGFYRGYVASLMTFVPNSALWWTFYHNYTECIASFLQNSLHLQVPSLAIQAVSGSCAGCSAAFITNPMDTIRTRLQVTGQRSIITTFQTLMREEGLGGLTKGLTARLFSTIPTSLIIVLGYETIKRNSLRSGI
ncbi:solute carrier family 25 member 44-like [Diadema setosum]|uniref:solute carrier family 25 member 44-like n=1 Tax=Diadema setosum TaxID=31175 RepID=UPI003B3B5574